MSSSFFSGKTAVITGAGGTLCSQVARELARQGARLVLLGRTPAKLEPVSADIRAAGGMALPIACDVMDRAAVERARDAVAREVGECDFLINGAGGNQADAITTTTEFSTTELESDRPAGTRGFFDLDLGRFDDVVRVNTLGTVIPCQIFGREMARRGRGSILNFASMNSYRPLTRVPAYAMAKAGVVSFTSWLAVYLAPAGIRVNAVAPGFFVNERSRKILMAPDGGLSDRGRTVMAHTPMKRFGEAADLLGAVCWLLDDTRAGFVTGVTLPIDGGFQASAGV